MFETLLKQANEILSSQNLGELSNPKLVIDPLSGQGYLEGGGDNPTKIKFTTDLVSGVTELDPNLETENEPVVEAEMEKENPTDETTEPEEKALEETLKTTEDMATEPVKEKSEDIPAEPVANAEIAETETLPKEKEKSEDTKEKSANPKPTLKPLVVKQKSYKPDLCNLYNILYPNSIQ